MTSGRYRLVWLAVLLSLAIRAVYFAQIQGNPFFDAPIMDEGYHDTWAKEIAAGDVFGKAPFYRAPLYPLLLGGAYSLFGPNYGLIRALQLAFGAITPLLVFAVARRLAPQGSLVPVAAAFAAALDGILLYYEADLLLESILAPLSMGFLLLMLRAGESSRWLDWLFAGIVLGLFAITRPNILLFAPFAFLLALGWRGPSFTLRRPNVAGAAAITAGVCLVVLPVTAVNLRVGHDRVLVAWQGGLNFFLGNNEEANGWSATAPRIMRTDWWGGYDDAIRIAEEAEGRKLRGSEISAYWARRGREWCAAHPGEALVMTFRKAVYFLSGEEFSNNRNLDLFIRDYGPIIRPMRHLLAVATPLAFWGALVAWRKRGVAGRSLALYLAVYAATVVLFFVTARYRVPVRPLILLFAVMGVASIVEMARGSRRNAGAVLAACAALGLALNLNPWVRDYEAPPAQFYQSIANIHHERGNDAQALQFQEKTLSIDPAYPDGNLNLGTMYMAMGRPQDAAAAHERERVLDPGDGRNLVSLAQAYAQLGRLDDAERAYSAAESGGFRDARAHYNHAILLERLGRPEAADSLYRMAVSVDSTFADAWNNLGVLQARAGNLERAIPLWERALQARPGDPNVLENLQRARARLTSSPNSTSPKGS